jgi:hypothetical protein
VTSHPSTVRRAAALAIALAVAAASPMARADDELPPLPVTTAQRLVAIERAFSVQDYPHVLELADSLIGLPDIEGRPEHVQVLEWTGAAHWFSGARDAARLVFGNLLREAPFHTLDAFIYPPELLTFFQERRTELVNARIIPARPEETIPDGAGPQRILVRELERRETPAIAYIAPFGVGQFANGEDGKGTVLAVIQGVGVATMAATWIGIETLKIGRSNQVDASDAGRARLLETLWYTGLGVFAATWVYGIVDGFAVRNSEPTVRERFEFIDGSAQPPSARLTPGPGGLGLGLDVRW